MPPDGSLEFAPYVIDEERMERWIGAPAWVPDRLAPVFTLTDLQPEPAYTPASTPPIAIAPLVGRVYALNSEADTFFGLLPGTNGTGPAMRRACAPAHYQWITSTGQPARGLYSVPADTSDDINTNPWSGRPSSTKARPNHRWAGLR